MMVRRLGWRPSGATPASAGDPVGPGAGGVDQDRRGEALAGFGADGPARLDGGDAAAGQHRAAGGADLAGEASGG